DILLIDYFNLEICQQQVGDGDSIVIQREPVSKMKSMAHSKNIKENVYDPLTLRVFEDQPSGAMDRVEPLVWLIAKIQEKFPDFSTLLSSSKEIQVRIGPLE